MAGLRSIVQRLRPRPRPIPDAHWRAALRTTPYARALPLQERQRLRELTAQFLRAKTFEPAAGIAITEAMRVRIALRACVPILHLGLDYYSGWSAVVLYPGDFRVRDTYMDEAGVEHHEIQDLCGQSMARGPMVLSWETIRAENPARGQDLVVHECAHKLDALNGAPDGFPPLHPDMQPREWTRTFRAAYDRLRGEVDAGRDTRLDPYAAADPAEFFAVLSEAFFTAPQPVYRDFPAVYDQLRLFYRQDPYGVIPTARGP